MTREEAQKLKTFKHYCTCGGHAWKINGRPESRPHMDWCPQAEEYNEWYDALHGKEPTQCLTDQALTVGEHIDQMREAYEALERERDEFRLELITRAGELQSMAEEKDELERERNALAAQLEAVRAAYNENKYIDDRDFAVMNVLDDTPAQSLNHIKAQIAERQCSELAAQVEEETIERAKYYLFGAGVKKAALSMEKNMTRKYAKQAGHKS